ncbi:MAG: DUF1611 domain-containing protein [Fimbriimonadaceae bacterium]
MLDAKARLALFMPGALLSDIGKTGVGVLRYSPLDVVAIIDPDAAGQDAARLLPRVRPCPIVARIEEAHAVGATALVLGTAPPGGRVPDDWWATIDRAVELGMSVVNGLHDRLAPRYPHLAKGQTVWDIRIEPADLKPGSGAAAFLPNRRVLLVGVDMAIGKMTAALELHAAAERRGLRSAFVATGQTGIMIAGRGTPLDAVRVDYAAGAVEREVMACADAEIVFVEGQGALNHPGATANLALMRGSMPTDLVLCTKAGMRELQKTPGYPLPPLSELLRLYEDLTSACGTFPRARARAAAVDTRGLDEDAAAKAIRAIEAEAHVPADDPVRNGADRLLSAILEA